MSETYATAAMAELRLSDGNWAPIRRHFGIGAFGVNAWSADEAGKDVIGEHTEETTGHEELYVVVSGHATFTIEGEQVDAAAGTLVFVRDPSAKRGAVATEPGTTVLAVGGKPDEAYAPLPWEENADIFPLFATGEYAEAKRRLEEAVARHDGAGGLLYNLACAESRLGEREQALEHLRQAIELDPRFAEYAQTDEDLEAIRAEAGFPAA